MSWKEMKFWLKSLIISILISLLIFIKDAYISITETANRTPVTADTIYSILSDVFIETFFIFLLLFITLLIIYWFISNLKSKENFKNWFFSRAPWKSGAILGVLISSIIPLIGNTFLLIFSLKYPINQVIGNFSSLPATIITGIFTGKFVLTQYIGEEGMAIIFLIPFSIIMYAIIGALIGFIVQKTKN